MAYTMNEAYIDKDYWEDDKQLAIMLPHSCDKWVIGDAKDARQLINDLERLIVELENKVATKEG